MKLVTGVSAGVWISGLLHAGLAVTLYYGVCLCKSAPIVAELDLSMMPLTDKSANAGGGYRAAPQAVWTAPQKGPAPAPQAPVETKEEVVRAETETSPCAQPCAASATGPGFGGGSGLGDGEFVPVSQTFKKPSWIKNFITANDYPLLARQQGKDGRVVLTILINAQGKVIDARLLQGSYEALNEVALRKIKEAQFSPAYNDQNFPVSCKVTLPIRFELR